MPTREGDIGPKFWETRKNYLEKRLRHPRQVSTLGGMKVSEHMAHSGAAS